MNIYICYVGEDKGRTAVATFSDKHECLHYMDTQNCNDVEVHELDNPSKYPEYHLTAEILREM